MTAISHQVSKNAKMPPTQHSPKPPLNLSNPQESKTEEEEKMRQPYSTHCRSNFRNIQPAKARVPLNAHIPLSIDLKSDHTRLAVEFLQEFRPIINDRLTGLRNLQIAIVDITLVAGRSPARHVVRGRRLQAREDLHASGGRKRRDGIEGVDVEAETALAAGEGGGDVEGRDSGGLIKDGGAVGRVVGQAARVAVVDRDVGGLDDGGVGEPAPGWGGGGSRTGEGEEGSECDGCELHFEERLIEEFDQGLNLCVEMIVKVGSSGKLFGFSSLLERRCDADDDSVLDVRWASLIHLQLHQPCASPPLFTAPEYPKYSLQLSQPRCTSTARFQNTQPPSSKAKAAG